MITPRSALKLDLFAEASRKRKIDAAGDPQSTAQSVLVLTPVRFSDGQMEYRLLDRMGYQRSCLPQARSHHHPRPQHQLALFPAHRG